MMKDTFLRAQKGCSARPARSAHKETGVSAPIRELLEVPEN